MKTLFDVTQINGMTLNNRIIRSATWEGMADSSGRLTDRLLRVYDSLVSGGVGLIITSATYFTKDSTPLPGMTGFYDDSFISDYRQFTDRIHAGGCPVILQMTYAGRDGEMWTPSSPSREDIQSIVQAFGDGAYRARQAGFDGVQVHAGHGFFLSQFLSSQANTRRDEYGGTVENRTRILLEIYEAIRARTGDDFNIWIKINGTDMADETAGQGACRYACQQLARRGVNAIEISGGTAELTQKLDHPHHESIFRDEAASIAAAVNVPVVLVGYNRTPSVMEDVLNSTPIEYFSLSRPLLREPDLVNRWKQDFQKKAECISCNGCFRADGNVCVFTD
ncbi:MAG TPA: NADH:flavin oxidoreductase [Patescibacteria group bacterium]|nr:NADH:flavin oxidoreductase [Patescibacteria group bacterium]